MARCEAGFAGIGAGAGAVRRGIITATALCSELGIAFVDDVTFCLPVTAFDDTTTCLSDVACWFVGAFLTGIG